MKALLTTALLLAGMLASGALVPAARAQADPDPGPPINDDRQRRGQTGMKFLSMSVDARAAALGNAMTAQSGSAINMMYNPAGIAYIETTTHVALSRLQWGAPDIDYNAAAIAFAPFEKRFGVVGFSVVTVNYGEFLGTIRADNEEGFIDTGTFSPSAWAFGVGYAHPLTEQFSVGGNVKYAREALGSNIMEVSEDGTEITQDNNETAVIFDFGVFFNTGFRSLDFAATVRNFSREVTYERENFEVPLALEVGASMDVLDFAPVDQEVHSLVMSVGAMRPRDFNEQVQIGGEYVFAETFSLRAGYAFPADAQGMSLGAGLNFDLGGTTLGADYAFTQFGDLGNMNRIGIQFGF